MKSDKDTNINRTAGRWEKETIRTKTTIAKQNKKNQYDQDVIINGRIGSW